MTLCDRAVTDGTPRVSNRFPPKPGFPTATEEPTALMPSLLSALTTRLSVPSRRVVAL